MVECEEKLRSGSDLVISLSIYLQPSAFQRFQQSSSDEGMDPKFWFNEGTESKDEEALRKRKSALRHLFEKLDLKPRAGNNAVLDKENVPPVPAHRKDKTPDNAIPERSNADANTPEAGDDTEGSEEEVLSQNELDVIYRRYCRIRNFVVKLTSVVPKSTSERCLYGRDGAG